MIKWLNQKIVEANRVFEEFSLDWKFHLNPGVNEEEIYTCEEELGKALPTSYRNFLLQYNGGCFFCSCSSMELEKISEYDSGLIIYGTKQLVEFEKKWMSGLNSNERLSLIPFCHSVSSWNGDFYSLNLQQVTNSEYAVLDCMHELVPAEWRLHPIAASFEEWLLRAFDQVITQKKTPEYQYDGTVPSSSWSLAEEVEWVGLRSRASNFCHE